VHASQPGRLVVLPSAALAPKSEYNYTLLSPTAPTSVAHVRLRFTSSSLSPVCLGFVGFSASVANHRWTEPSLAPSSPGPAPSLITPNHQSRVYLHLHPGVGPITQLSLLHSDIDLSLASRELIVSTDVDSAARDSLRPSARYHEESPSLHFLRIILPLQQNS
jgi:hypothetical protein